MPKELRVHSVDELQGHLIRIFEENALPLCQCVIAERTEFWQILITPEPDKSKETAGACSRAGLTAIQSTDRPGIIQCICDKAIVQQ